MQRGDAEMSHAQLSAEGVQGLLVAIGIRQSVRYSAIDLGALFVQVSWRRRGWAGQLCPALGLGSRDASLPTRG